MDLEETASERGMKWFGRILAIIIILAVSAFGDVMYISLMSSKFPSGLLLVVCYIGAFTSLLAMIYMLIGKSVLFTPGPQMVVAWVIFSVELLLTAMNIILVFQGDGAGGFLEVWNQLAPATPVINMAGVAILFFLDESQKMKHEDVELSWDMKRANRRHFKAMARARLKLQTKQLEFLVTELDRAVSRPESLAAIQQTAIDLNTHLLGQLSGGRTYRVPAQLPAPTGVPALPSPTHPTQGPTGPEVSGEKPGLLGKAKNALGGLFGGQSNLQESRAKLWEAESAAGMSAWNQKKAEQDASQPPASPLAALNTFADALAARKQDDQSVPPVEPATSPTSPALAALEWFAAWEQHPQKGAISFDDFLRQASAAPFVAAPTATNGNGASQNGH